MRLDQFPRPRGDTGIGFHYVADTHHYDRESLDYWLGELKDLGASWLVLPSSLETPIPDFFLRGLIGAAIEPIILVDVRPIQPVDRSLLLETCRTYAECGVYYFGIYAEPNLATRWRIDDWTAPGLVERFASMLVPALETIHQADLFPLISPLAPGGHYWDLTFLRTLLGILARESNKHLRERLSLGIQCEVGNRPLTWGRGGPARWPNVRPYDCPDGSQDHRGFAVFEWYDALVRECLGDSLPLICTRTRLVPGDQDDPSLPILDDVAHGMRSAEIARMVMDGEVSDVAFNTSFWTLAAADDDPSDGHAWYRRDTSTLPAVGALKQLKKHPRRFTWDEPADDARPGVLARPIYHYVLLQAPATTVAIESQQSRWMLSATRDYVAHFRPTVGFSEEEARHASRVTIVGTDSKSVAGAEEALRESGCLVEAVEGGSEEQIHLALDELIHRGRRFRKLPG